MDTSEKELWGMNVSSFSKRRMIDLVVLTGNLVLLIVIMWKYITETIYAIINNKKNIKR